MSLKIERKQAGFAKKLLQWRKENNLDSEFPWRNTQDPYKILVCEILLRKTTRKQVREVFAKFFAKYPDVQTLASATSKLIEDTIRPLGMEHKRATSLKKLAEVVVKEHGSKIPCNSDQLLKLPGVGLYATNAVLCFAYGKNLPLVDTNVVRVITRVFSFKSVKKRARTDPAIWESVSKMIPKGKARDFNLGILDFAPSVCMPRNPECVKCVMNSLCGYAQK